MSFTETIAYYISGALAANAIPHVVNGISGRKFPERLPFKKPGQNESAFETFFFSPVINVIWGMLNLAIAFVVVNTAGVFRIGLTADMLVFTLGFASAAIFLAWNMGRVHYKRNGG